MQRRALFLDRDGTLIHTVHYPSRPEQLRLYDNIGPDLQALQSSGFYLVMITNQSGIARGFFLERDLELMHRGLAGQLQELRVRLDAIYYCPHHPEGIVEPYIQDCQCRKPRPGMLLQAASDLDIDLRRSWFIGDILDDIEAGKRAGCRTILIDRGTEARPMTELRTPTFVARDTRHALSIVRAMTALEEQLDPFYLPPSWIHENSTEAPVCNINV